ncbi:hypothetical protein A3Q56_04747 [Intoshia linei]|uniref:Uncharacterized protein n=1 Tax=Intoshia linei TaxID=1819745 RepID=A0A177AZS0_9BILA|nr:hypothetical protein A3Q56_04747 [Intoshia linei]
MNEYPDILSSKKPIRTIKIKKDSSIDELYEYNVNDSDYAEYVESNCLSQSEIDNSIADLNLSIEKSEYLSKKLKQHKLVEKNVTSTFHRLRNRIYSRFYIENDGLFYCNDVDHLMIALKIKYKVSDCTIQKYIVASLTCEIMFVFSIFESVSENRR